MLKNGLISRDLVPADCTRLPNLLEKVWNIRTTKDYWEWKFLKPPFETKGMVIEDTNREIVAFAGFWLRPTRFGGKTIFPGTLIDLMVDREYRGKKAFLCFLKRIDSEFSVKRTFFGFPNPVSHKLFYRAFKKYVTINTNISILVSLVAVGSYARSNKSIKALASGISRTTHKLRFAFHRNKEVFVHRVQDVGDEFDELWEDISGEYFWIQNRGKDFVKWRYLLNPTDKYQVWKATEGERIVGYLVTTIKWEVDRTKGFFIDWFVSRKRKDVFLELVNTAFRWLVNQNVDLVETWLMDHERQWATVLRSYFFIKSKRERALTLGAGPDYFDPNLHRTENFFFTLGDSDYIGAA